MQTAILQPQPSRSSNFHTASEAHLAWYDVKKAENSVRILSVLKTHRSRATQAGCKLIERSIEFRSIRPLIAVVDDEPIIAITLAEILMRRGFDAVWFSASNEALDFFTECRADLLLSDIAMPAMDGISLAAKILELSSECAILLFSTRSHETEVRRRVRLLSADIHLEVKPLNAVSLVTTILQILKNS